jgi:hypothetical protein
MLLNFWLCASGVQLVLGSVGDDNQLERMMIRLELAYRRSDDYDSVSKEVRYDIKAIR